MRRILFSLITLSAALNAESQLVIDGGTLFIQPGATLTVQGDITSNVSIQGTGLIQLKGTSLQNMDMGGNTIPYLELDNLANARLLNTDTRIGNNFLLTNGKFQTGTLNLILGSTATITGGGLLKFIWTNGTGQLKKELTADIPSFELPVGENANYRPAYLVTTGSTYTSANVGVRVLGSADLNLPLMPGSYITANWPVTKTGITGGTVTVTGQYLDPTDLFGTEANLRGYFYNGTDWSSTGETHDAALNRVSVPVSSSSGSVTAINKFILVGAKAFLQGAYSSGSGLMTDLLRTLPFGSSSNTANFPSTDPYRVSPYTVTFTHFNNPITEAIINAAVAGPQSNTNKNLVDWVYLELRNTNAPSGDIQETRSALILKDGTITDMDGTSPVTFNNMLDGNYLLAVRHRNHLGLGIDPSSPRAINETKSTAYTTNLIDFRTASDANLYGTSTAYVSSTHPTLGAVKLLWGGNANRNTAVRASGPISINDYSYLITTILGGDVTAIISNIYSSADLNMDTKIRASGILSINDYIFLITTILAGDVTKIITQQL